MSTTAAAETPNAANTLTEVPTRKRLRGRTLLQVALLTAVALGAAGYGAHWWTTARFREATDDAYVGGDLTVIGSKVNGYISELPVTDNQFVHAGDLLARIDDRDYRAALAKAKAVIDAQDAAVSNLGASAALQQSLIARSNAGIDAASAEEDRARDDFRRYKDLVGRSAVSVESAQRTEATFKTAQANMARAKAEQQAAMRQLDVIATQKQQALAALEQARAEYEIAQLNVGYTEIRAPRDGYVGNRKARVGIYANTGTQLMSVVPARGLWIDANFKEDQLSRMHAGQAVSIRADSLPGQVLHGRLGSLAPATGAQFSILPPENATGNFTKIVQRVPVRVELDAADDQLGRLRPGLSVVVEVDTKTAQTTASPQLAEGGGTRSAQGVAAATVSLK
ncbi:MAG TPA: HlyD family secretion protein [Burkholderiaceae bacterium]|jgi:membrane fusion protein (multidrug efflux system)